MKQNVTSSAVLVITRDGQDIELYVKGKGYVDSGRLSGPPEYCYPAEGEIEIVFIEDENGKEWAYSDLSDKEVDLAVDLLWENAEPSYDDDYGPEYDPDDK